MCIYKAACQRQLVGTTQIHTLQRTWCHRSPAFKDRASKKGVSLRPQNSFLAHCLLPSNSPCIKVNSSRILVSTLLCRARTVTGFASQHQKLPQPHQPLQEEYLHSVKALLLALVCWKGPASTEVYTITHSSHMLISLLYHHQ